MPGATTASQSNDCELLILAHCSHLDIAAVDGLGVAHDSAAVRYQCDKDSVSELFVCLLWWSVATGQPSTA